ncbi:uncharacterized protein [Amphiura filiformis]|uniref:uncharacterized protein n=1 Tax=Amphiura filiformis TaxID=82378 RepID=UPI003B213A21
MANRRTANRVTILHKARQGLLALPVEDLLQPNPRQSRHNHPAAYKVTIVAIVFLLQASHVHGCKRVRKHKVPARGSLLNRVTTAAAKTSQERNTLQQQQSLSHGSIQDTSLSKERASATANKLQKLLNGSTREDAAQTYTESLPQRQQQQKQRRRKQRCDPNFPGCYARPAATPTSLSPSTTPSVLRSAISNGTSHTEVNNPGSYRRPTTERQQRCDPNFPGCYDRPVATPSSLSPATTPSALTPARSAMANGTSHTEANDPGTEMNTSGAYGSMNASNEANITNGNETFQIHFMCHNATPNSQQINNSSRNLVDWTRHFGECDKESVLQRTRGPLNDMSLCPWTYVENIDVNREPPSLMFARCECPHCVIDGTFSHTRGYRCTPVFMKMTVRRNGYHDIENVPVACVCSRPREL